MEDKSSSFYSAWLVASQGLGRCPRGGRADGNLMGGIKGDWLENAGEGFPCQETLGRGDFEESSVQWGYDIGLVGVTWALVLRAPLSGLGFFPGDLWRRQKGIGDWGGMEVIK